MTAESLGEIMADITAQEAWERLEKETHGSVTPLDVLNYIGQNADGWAAQLAKMAFLVAITENW